MQLIGNAFITDILQNLENDKYNDLLNGNTYMGKNGYVNTFYNLRKVTATLTKIHYYKELMIPNGLNLGSYKMPNTKGSAGLDIEKESNAQRNAIEDYNNQFAKEFASLIEFIEIKYKDNKMINMDS